MRAVATMIPLLKHTAVEGKYTAQTAHYPSSMCEAIINAMYPERTNAFVPSMQCVPSSNHNEHREKENFSVDFADIPHHEPVAFVCEGDPEFHGHLKGFSAITKEEATDIRAALGAPDVIGAVTRLLDRKEWKSNPKAYEAIQSEADGLVAAGTWDHSTVQEKADVAAEAKSSGVSVHFGQLMTIVSEKYAELKEHLRVLKGRIVFRGDIVRDENGALGVFQNLAANPTSVQGLNHCIAYGGLPGHKTTQADAVKAHAQSILKSKHKTWVSLPYELWPKGWEKDSPNRSFF